MLQLCPEYSFLCFTLGTLKMGYFPVWLALLDGTSSGNCNCEKLLHLGVEKYTKRLTSLKTQYTPQLISQSLRTLGVAILPLAQQYSSHCELEMTVGSVAVWTQTGRELSGCLKACLV